MPNLCPEPIDTTNLILSHLADLHHTQTTLREQSVGVANQILILEHILTDLGIPIPSPSLTGVPFAAKTEAPEGSPPADPDVPETGTGAGTLPGSIIL